MNKKRSIVTIIILSILILALSIAIVWFLLLIKPQNKDNKISNIKNIVDDVFNSNEETWSSEYIYWAQQTNTDDINRSYPVFLMDADGTNQEQVFYNDNILDSSDGVVVINDGSRLLTNCSNSEPDYCLLDKEGKRVGDASASDIESIKNINDILLSNGKIIYVKDDNIWVRDGDGSNDTQLTKVGENTSPRISSDERRVVFVSNRDDQATTEIYSMYIDGADQKRLTENNVNDFSPSWSKNKITGLGVDFTKSREVLENFMKAKINGDSDIINNFATSNLKEKHANALGKFDQVVSEYKINAEREIGAEDIEYDVEINFNDQTISSIEYSYTLHLTDGKWLVDNQKDLAEKEEEKVVVSEVNTGSVDTSRTEIESLQKKVEDGEDLWRLDPTQVAMVDGEQYGFSKNDDEYTQVSKVSRGEYSGTGEATIEVIHGDSTYIIQLMQPGTQGDKGIWTINSIVKK